MIGRASSEKNADLSLYDALCRATILLIVAHLEGFVKDVAKAVIYDINKFSSFQRSPLALQRTFCRTFINPSIGEHKDTEERTRKLISTLSTLDTKFVIEPFLIQGSHGNNKNLSPSVINKICENFGVRNFFSWLNNSKMDVVFSNAKSDIDQLLNELRIHVLSSAQIYPYSFDLSLFGIAEPQANTGDGSRTLWKSFLDSLLQNRNDIGILSIITGETFVRHLLTAPIPYVVPSMVTVILHLVDVCETLYTLPVFWRFTRFCRILSIIAAEPPDKPAHIW